MQCTDSTVPDKSLNSADLRVDTHACMYVHTHTHTHMTAGCGISHKNTINVLYSVLWIILTLRNFVY